jgi:uncharacterized protein with von Willebrand factor type A (vWA) domain
MIQRQTSLSINTIEFCRFLRRNNFTVSLHEEIAALKALTFIDFEEKQNFGLALKTVLCKSYPDLQAFDNLFEKYWKERDRAIDSKIKEKKNLADQKVKRDSLHALKSWLNKGVQNESEQIATYSYQEALSRKDFSTIPADEVDELIRIIKEVSRRLANRVNRRYERSHSVDMPDLRRTLRLNLRRGGELIELEFRKPKLTRTNLLIFCDVSKSMELYSVFLMQFLYAFKKVYKYQEAFTFGTSLQRITPYLKHNDFNAVMDALRDHADSWNSGTRIGASLNAFIDEYAPRILKKNTIVIILSDGWDTGEIPLLQKAMEYLHAHTKKIIWLNPLAGSRSYKPLTAGMQAALPFVDVFASVHNAESLRGISAWLR